MNGSACSALLEQVAWDNPSLIASLVVLLLISVMVIVGNCLVIAAVFISSKLRSVTNLFIVSLAVADLMVGLAVLPFSATWEVFKVSPFLCFLTGHTAIKTFRISADGSECTESLQTQYSLRTAQLTYAMNSI
jgi:hypothetical protein